jgi:hypothetical protein
MIVAVIVAVLLISTAVYVLVISDGDEEEGIGLELESEILPSDDITMEALGMVELSVTSMLVNDTEDISHEIDDWTNVTYSWSRSPYELGSFDLLARRVVHFTATNVTMTGTVTCTVEWEDESVQVSADITINPPYLDSVLVAPDSWQLAPEESHVFTASALNSVGDLMTGVTFSWTVTGINPANYTLSATVGSSVTFTGLMEGDTNLSGTLNATCTVGGITKVGGAQITVGGAPQRTVDYLYYDLFNVPFGEWWDWRWTYYGTEEVVTREYPYIFKWYGNATNVWLYANQRLNVTGRNMPEINMNERPEFLPFLGEARGGTAKIDWYMQYLTEEEMSRYPENTAAWLDGWVIALNGTVTLDRTAAMAVMGITSDGFDDFDTWWAANDDTFLLDYIDWILYEGNERLDIFCSYEYPLTPLSFNIAAEKVGDEIVLTYDTVSWGMEAMMFRWLEEAFMPVEWYYEDMYFRATIGPQYTDMDMDTAVVYAAYAYETTLDAAPCWMWEALMQDYVPSFGTHDYSLFDVYKDLSYVNYAPGSPWYGTYMPYDYAPGAHNLSANETMVLEWPGEDYLLFYTHDEPYKTFNWTGSMTCNYSEPDWVEFPGQVVLDKDARTLSFEGPLDFWTWSNLQADLYLTGDTRYDNLGSEWNRVGGVLPYGCPTIEFRLASDEDPVPYTLRVEGVESPIEEDTLTGVTVTVLDQFGTLYPTYTGTIEFSSNDTGATLPAQYTFQAADLGSKSFPDSVMFSTAGIYYVMAEDVSVATLFGSQENIEVYSSSVATSLLVEGVTSPIMEGVASGFTVTVLDQAGLPYTGAYVGTISFSSNDSAADLPLDYTFTLLDAGTHSWDAADGVTFNTAGTRDLTAADASDPTISGSQLGIVVTAAPMMDSFEVVLSADTAIANDTSLDITVTALDQFGSPYTDYVGTVVFSSDDTVAVLPTLDLTFLAGDLGVKTWTGIVMGTPGLRTVTVTDSVDAAITGSDDVTVTAERTATYFVITDMAPTVQINVAETFTVTVYDQYDDVFLPYDGIATFGTNRSGEVTLPPNYDFSPADLGTHDFDVTFTVENYFTVTVADQADGTIAGEVTDIRVTSVAPELDHFTVEGITSPMWEDNYSDVTVTAYDQFGGVFTAYVGTIEFSTDAVDFDLPADYTFLVADDGVKTFAMGVMFEDGGTYDVTVTDTSGGETGSQLDIEIVELVATILEITGEPTAVVAPGETFSLTVSVYHQFDELCYEYEGTVEFTTSDADAGVVLPSPYTFTLADAGTHVFADEFALMTDGDQTIMAEDSADATLTDTVTVTVESPPEREVDYKIYDFLAEPFGAWWTDRYSDYATDVVISEGTNANVYLYYVENAGIGEPANALTQGMLYAPYRYNITAKNLTGLNVHAPEFLELMGSGPVDGAQADMNIYFQYMYDPWFTDTRNDWVGTGYYGSMPNSLYLKNFQDGYVVQTLYDVKLNREAALEWLDIPLSETDPEGWYDSVGDDYSVAWGDWFLYEGDTRLDIAYGYEDNYYSEYTASRLFYDSGTGEVNLQVLHFNWGYEVLATRWLTEAGVSPNHEPWYEDFNLDVHYGEEYTNLSMDAVCQYSLHAVKANGTVDGAAWAWEPAHIDYAVDDDFPNWYVPPMDLPNEYLPYSTLSYQSWNAGDNLFSDEVYYEYTPYWFNLTEGERLMFEMPATDVLGFDGVGLDYTDYLDAEDADFTAFEAIESTAAMSLGYFVTGGVDLAPLVSGTTLAIEGPVSFDNVRHSPDGPLYHGAPWIEFNVGATKLAVMDSPDPPTSSVPAGLASAVAAGSGSASGEISMVAAVCATMVAVAALGAGRRVSV